MNVLGWDIGGANTKAALVAEDSLRVSRRPYRVWEDPTGLPEVLAEMVAGLGPAELVGVTLTAELADCFATKAEGVGHVLDAVAAACPGVPVRVFTVDGDFASLRQARRDPRRVASANWAATARLLARAGEDAILVDVGSTTTDVVSVVGGAVAARGRDDTARLAAGELVYSGAVRTPVCAIVRHVPLRGGSCPVAAEFFAQAGDAHRWLGSLAESDYVGGTPDGRGTSRREAGARLARMVCADPADLSPEDIDAIARHVAARQVDRIARALRRVRGAVGGRAPRWVVVAGSGCFLGRAAGEALGLDVRSLAETIGEEGSRAAPAVAVARLLLERVGGGRGWE